MNNSGYSIQNGHVKIYGEVINRDRKVLRDLEVDKKRNQSTDTCNNSSEGGDTDWSISYEKL